MSAKKTDTILPPMTVARVAECMKLVESLVTENVDLFGQNVARHRAARLESSKRPLTGQEAASVAAGLGIAADTEGFADKVVEIQQSDLRAADEVPMQEVLMVAGVSTAPAAIEAATKLVALVEMPAEDFKKAREAGELRNAIDEAAEVLGDVDAVEARERASRALTHFQQAAGADSGEARSLIFRIVTEALGQAIENAPNLGSTLASLTGSLEPTDGNVE